MSDHETRPHLKYSNEHEWVEIQGDTAVVGITPYAQESLGDLVYIELPEKGARIDSGDSFAVVESVKAASEVYAPLSGEVLEVNDELPDAPETINQSPYDDGWIAKLRISNPKELEELMDAPTYAHYLETLD